jgi:PKD domain-containing protein
VRLAILGRPARFAVALLSMVGALCFGIGDEEARAAWIAPFSVSLVGGTATDPQVATDGQGDLTVAWTGGSGNTGIMVAEHSAGGVWTFPIERIPSSSNCHDPRLAVDSAGAAVLVADCGTGATLMRSASRAAVGGWSSSVTITGTGNGEEPRVGIDSSGNAAMVFAGAANTVQAGYLPAGGTWSSIVQLSTALKTATKPNLAMTPTGAADAVWLEKREETGFPGDPVVNVMLDRKHGAAAWTASSRLTINSAPGSMTPVAEGEPMIEVSDQWQIAGWLQSNSSTAFVVERTSSNDFGGFVEPSTTLSEAGSIEAPALAIDGSGHDIAAWRGFSVSFPGSFELRGSTTTSSNGAWASPSILEETGPTGGTEPGLALDAGGNATVAWNPASSTIRAATRPAAGAFAPATTISSASHTAFGAPAVGVALGDGLVAWPSATGGAHIALAIDDVTPPAVSASSPAPVNLGLPVALSATATDAWGTPSVKWEFGDGSSASGASVSRTYASAGTRTATVTATDGGGNSASTSVTVVVTDSSGSGAGGSGSASGAGTVGAGGGSQPPRHQIEVTARPMPQSWAKQAKAQAIQVRCKLDVAGTCTAVATVTRAVAKKLGLKLPKGRKPVRIGSGKASVAANRLAVVKVELTTKALTAIAASTQPVPVTFALEGTAAGNDPGHANQQPHPASLAALDLKAPMGDSNCAARQSAVEGAALVSDFDALESVDFDSPPPLSPLLPPPSELAPLPPPLRLP